MLLHFHQAGNIQKSLNWPQHKHEMQKYKQGGVEALQIHSKFFCLQSVALELAGTLIVGRYFYFHCTASSFQLSH